jgi:hypothetical protein
LEVIHACAIGAKVLGEKERERERKGETDRERKGEKERQRS